MTLVATPGLRCVAAGVLLAAAVWSVSASAFDFNGDKRLRAIFRDGSTQHLGVVSFSSMPQSADISFKVKLDTAVLQDFFLSMREFKCLPAATEVTCVVPYPYPQPGKVTSADLSWLEHNLRFLFKQPADFGAKLWNGVMFKFAASGGALVGRPQAVDLNQMSAPPDNPNQPPFGPMEREPYAPGARWLSELRIE